MPYINEHIVMGHLGQDPQCGYSKNGKAYARFSVATTEKWKDNDGQPRERTDWHNVVVWGSGAEFAKEYLHKGDLVLVKAPSRTRQWADKEGNQRYTTELICTRYEHLMALKTRGKDEKSEGTKPVQEDFDDDIPF